MISKSSLLKRFFASTVKRNSSFSALLNSVLNHSLSTQNTLQDVQFFQKILPKNSVITDQDQIQKYNVDWIGKYKGNCNLVLRPGSTQDVSSILSYCNDRKLAVVPQGGNTGLVGGSVGLFDQIVISMNRMNKITSFDELSGIVTSEAGVIKQDLDDFLDDKGYILPFDLGAKGSCLIGGNLSTNAGGVRMIKYGSLRGSTVGIKAVLPSGEVINNMTGLLKDNTGYDLKQFFLGAEGTLGIITEAQIICPVKPKSQTVAVFKMKSFDNVLETLKISKKKLGGFLSAIEYMDQYSMKIVEQQLNKPSIFTKQQNKRYFYVIIETSTSEDSGMDKQALLSLLQHYLSEIVQDGVLSHDLNNFNELWNYRQNVAVAARHLGYNFKYDLSLQRNFHNQLVQEVRQKCGDKAFTVGYGHIGDGNLHINVVVPGYDNTEAQAEVGELLEPFVFDYVRDKAGSVSAEHGIGYTKPQYLRHSKSEESVKTMSKIKAALDPNGIMNPYKVFPQNQQAKKKRFQ